MGECCSIEQTPRLQRRINGLQLPLNCQQVIAWIVFIVTLVANFGVLVRIQSQEVEIISLIIYVILYVSHIAAHVSALLIDPSEKELRKLKVQNVPEFDRSLHAHVIENGRCHLCNIYTSSKSTKHCSICNKCVEQFDHHCKWLNNCVGQRNYAAFITCVTTAQLIAMLTTLLCIVAIILFLLYPQKLSQSAQDFIQCNSSSGINNSNKYCKNSISFLTFLVVFCGSALAIGCALLHLCCFHIYISTLGVTTYEYIVRESRAKSARPRSLQNANCCAAICCGKVFITSKYKEKKTKVKADMEIGDNKADTSNATETHATNSQLNKGGVRSLINILISNEFNRTKKIFNDKNQVYPQTDDTTS